MFKKDFVKKAKKAWKVNPSRNKTFGNKIYILIGIGYQGYGSIGLDQNKVKEVEVGEDKEGKKIYATYFFGNDF